MKISHADFVRKLRAFYDSAEQDLDQYRDADGDIADIYAYDKHLGDIEIDCYEIVGVLLAQVEDEWEGAA